MIVNEIEVTRVMNEKKEAHILESVKRFGEKNPKYVVVPDFTEEEGAILLKVQYENLDLNTVEEPAKSKIFKYFEDIMKVEQAAKDNLLDLDLFNEEELIKAFSFTKEDIQKIIYTDGEEKK